MGCGAGCRACGAAGLSAMRMERLIGIMCVLADTQRTTIRALAERFEVSTRTIARDLDALGRAGVPLVTFPGAGGGVGVVEGFKVRRDLLSTHDAAALYAALDGLRSVDGDQAVTQLIARLVPGADANPRAAAGGPIALDLSSWFADGVVQEKLALLLDAVRGRRCARIEYVARSGRGTRVVEPARLVYKQSSWYLHAFCREREAFRLFKLKRIAALDVLDETFEPRDAPPLALSAPDAPLLLPPDEDAPGTVLVELDYDAANEFTLAETIDARFLERDPGEAVGVARFRTDDVAWARRLAGWLGDLVRFREP